MTRPQLRTRSEVMIAKHLARKRRLAKASKDADWCEDNPYWLGSDDSLSDDVGCKTIWCNGCDTWLEDCCCVDEALIEDMYRQKRWNELCPR